MTMPDEKLTRGIDLLRQANGDPDLVGVALLAFQGALAEYLRGLVATNASLTDEDRAALERATTIPALVELGRRHGDLARDDAWRIIEAERLRVGFARGEAFRGSPAEVYSYGQFVAELCGAKALIEEFQNMPLQTPATDPEQDVEEDEPIGNELYYAIMRWLPGLCFALLLGFGLWWLLNQVNRKTPSQTDTTGNPMPSLVTTFAPILESDITTTPQATPTTTLQRGRVVRLAGEPGWLHEKPSFDSPTLPIRLQEGQEVGLPGQQESDSQGIIWMYVVINGYQGWSPANNIDLIGPATPVPTSLTATPIN